MRRRFFCLSIFLFCFFVFSFSARAAGPTYISYSVDNPSIWTKENGPYIIQNHVIVKAPLTIEAGTIVKFNVGSIADLTIQNDFYVKGTRDNPVVFTSIRDDSYGGDTNYDGNANKPVIGDWSALNFNPAEDKVLNINHAKIFYSNFGISIYSTSNYYKNRTVKNCEMRKNGYGIFVYNAEPVIENNVIADNQTGILVQASTRKAKIVNNSIFQNKFGAQGINSAKPALGALDAKYNWWGDKSGPQNESNLSGKGNAVIGLVSYDPWLKEDPIQTPDPVIIIPGIMGSWKKDGIWQIDPIFHTYDNLCDEFLANGYENGKNFSVFPYQWRDSNVKNAELLHDRINQIKLETGRPKVDIVAHSMGGLLAREYVESGYYQNDVDQLITIGTPHLGAPKDYVTWEAGEFLGLWSPILKRIVALEALENGYLDVFQYIHKRPMTSVEELLPTYNYLYDETEDDYILRDSYPDNYPRNEFLENLNGAENITQLKKIEFTKIVGKTNSETSTVSSYNVVDGDILGLWTDGYPKYFNIPVLNRQGITKSGGDGTVPLYSAEATDIPADKTIYLESEHNELPTNAQKDILEIFTGKRPAGEITKWHMPNLLLILVHSPVDIQVESPLGYKIGKNFDTDEIYDEIEGAYYTGFDTKSEFITIPISKEVEGEYKILAQGTGEGGSYEIEAAVISEDPSDPDNAKESTVTVEGNAEPGKVQEVEVDVKQDQVAYSPDTTPPTISIFSPEEMDYTNDKVLTIDFNAEDTGSGIASVDWQVKKDGQNLDWQEKSVDLSLKYLGSYILEVSAADKVGNSDTKEAKFQITTSLDAIRNNLDHYFDLGLVKKKIAYKYFSVKLKNLEKLFNLLEKTENSKLKLKPKEAAVKAIKKAIDANIDQIIRQIKRKSPQWIDQKAADLLVEDLNAIKIK